MCIFNSILVPTTSLCAGSTRPSGPGRAQAVGWEHQSNQQETDIFWHKKFPTCQVRVVRFYQSACPPPPPRLVVLLAVLLAWTSTCELPSSVCTAGPQRTDRMPEDMPDGMSDRMPEDMPDKMPWDMSDRMKVCQMECQIKCQIECHKIC